MRKSLISLFCATLPGIFFLVSAEEKGTEPKRQEPLVVIESGDLPIILSAPHGGRRPVPGVAPRKGQDVPRFVARSDSWTDELTEKLADEIEKNTGQRPYVVIAKFHRKFIDANRPPERAYESEAAKETYEAYHKALADAREEVIARWGTGILLDIHGQAAELDTIIRGTRNGETVTHLIEKFNQDSLIGKSSLLGHLSAQGLTVHPPVNSTQNEHKSYSGGHIVGTYGSGKGGTLDAIQLELGRNLRRPAAHSDTAKKLATAIQNFTRQYLPSAKSPDALNVGVYLDKGAGKSKIQLLQALTTFDGISIQHLTAKDIQSGKLDQLDVLIQPGGSGGGQGRHLGEDGRKKIRQFLKNGGGYIGICAGAYLASADYSWSLNILDAKVIDRKHWARGNGTVKLTLSNSGKDLLQTSDKSLEIFYAQGPLLAPADNPDIPDYDPVATFQTEIAQKGAPKGVMIGTTAIAEGRFGKGRVICFSPHPELTEGLHHLIQCALHKVNQGQSHQVK